MVSNRSRGFHWGDLSCSAAALILSAYPHIAHAQAAPSSPTAAASQTPDTQASSQDIVVTAQKRDERLSKTPLAITALAGAQLQAAGVTSVKDLTTVAPSIQISTVGGASAVLVSMRGISNEDFNAGGNPEAATYIDGIYVGRTTGLNGSFYDLGRVEVVRGPQGTLYGRNSNGGNVNILTADPVHDFHASAFASLGNYTDVQVQTMLNMPVTNTLAARLSFAVHRNDGYYDTLGVTDRRYAKAQNFAGRLTFLWEPVANFKWRLSADRFSERGTPLYSVDIGPNGRPADGLPVFQRPIPNTDQPRNDLDNTMIRSRMDLKLSDSVSVQYLAGYQWLNSINQSAATASTYDGYRPETFTGQSHEVDLSFDRGMFSNILGGNYYRLNVTTADKYRLPVFGVFSDTAAHGPTKYHDTSWGVFDQAKVRLNEKLSVTGGIRYSHETGGSDGGASSLCPLSLYPNLPFDSSHFFGPGCSLNTRGPTSDSWSSVTWRANAEYAASPATFLYAGVSTGFKSGGLNPLITGIANYAPEKVTNYEAGVRWKAPNNNASLNLTGFYMNYTDIQVHQFIGVNGVTTNAGGAHIYGAEIEGQIRLSPNDRLSGFATYTHATYSKFLNAVDQQTNVIYPDISGNTLPHAPRFTLRAEYSHDFGLENGGKITPKASIYWQSKNYLRELNLPIDTVPNYSLTTLSLAYTSPNTRWKFTAFVHNLEDRRVRTYALTALGHYFSDYMTPRTFGASVAFNY